MKILRPIAFAVAALLCAGVLGATSVPADAQTPCMPAAEANAHLQQQYDEEPTGRGVMAGRLVLLYTAADGSTWTVAVVDPRSGLMCILAAGESWEDVPRPPVGAPS